MLTLHFSFEDRLEQKLSMFLKCCFMKACNSPPQGVIGNFWHHGKDQTMKFFLYLLSAQLPISPVFIRSALTGLISRDPLTTIQAPRPAQFLEKFQLSSQGLVVLKNASNGRIKWLQIKSELKQFWWIVPLIYVVIMALNERRKKRGGLELLLKKYYKKSGH